MANLVYPSFQQAEQQLHELLPVDYFLAQEILSSLASNTTETSVQQVLFHCIIAVSQSIQQGHTCLPLSIIAGTRVGFASDNDGNIVKQGYVFPSLNELVNILNQFDLAAEHSQMLVMIDEHLYLRRYYLFEQELKQQLSERITHNHQYHTTDIQQVLKQLFPEENSAITDEHEIDWQKVAVANALNKNFTVIAGGPGTGKTYTVTKLLAALVMLEQQTSSQTQNKQQPTRYALVAPTGKAAQRLSESIQQAIQQFTGSINDQILAKIPTAALTIHRLLGYIPNSPNFRYNQTNKLPIDFLLIDEASMVDLALLTRVFRALPAHCKIVLLGDADQLPSVAVGNVLADIAPRPHPGYSQANCQYLQSATKFNFKQGKKALADHLTFLLKSRRFDGEGGIGKLAKAVIAGDAKTSWQLLNSSSTQNNTTNNDLTLIQQQPIETMNNEVNNRYLIDYIQQYYVSLFSANNINQAFTALHKFRILCATRKGQQGVESINDFVLHYFQKLGLVNSHQAIFHGMPILITENHHKLGIYNGDIGMIWRNNAGHLMAMFESSNEASGYKTIIPSRLPKYEPVYAMTIHKTQGSEFTHVLMVLPSQNDNKLLSRELLYTGITRAKKQLSIASSDNIWRHGVECEVTRYSLLGL